MVRAELGGSHTHDVGNGKQVHIYQRSGSYLVRGRYQRKSFGEGLGSNPTEALIRLREILVQLNNGTFERPTEARQAIVPPQVPTSLTFRELVNRYLCDVKQRKGSRTEKNCVARLTPLLEFVEQPEIHKKFPIPARVTNEFTQRFVTFLRGRTVTRNGKPCGKKHLMSRKHQENCLTTVRSLFNWGQHPTQSLLPVVMVNPFTTDLLGTKTVKDPLRANKIPLNTRIALVEQMSRWELLNLSFQVVLPIRPDELCAAFVEDLDLSQGAWQVGTKGDDWYFTKGRTSFSLPLPPVLVRLGRILVREHRHGPLFQKFDDTASNVSCVSIDDEASSFGDDLLEDLNKDATKRSLPSQDRKEAFLKAMVEAGGLSTDYLRKQWRRLFRQVGLPDSVRPYDLRSAVSTDMHQAGIRHLELRYLTGHTTSDIMNEYVSLDVHSEMDKYYRSIQTLLTAIEQRAGVLGLWNDIETPADESRAMIPVDAPAAITKWTAAAGACRTSVTGIEYWDCSLF